MPEAIRSLIIEPDPDMPRHVYILGRQTGVVDIRWKSDSVAEGLEIVHKFRPDMAIVGVNGDPAASIAPLAAEFPGLYILALAFSADAEHALQAMRAGAHDLLQKPVREVDLCIAAEKVLKARARKEPSERRGKIVTVFSNKGGNGTTTIAANLADALVSHHGKRVVLVDLVLAHGDVTLFFNANPTYTILDLARNTRKADPEYLQSLLVQHGSGVYILADPPRIEDLALTARAAFNPVVRLFKRSAEDLAATVRPGWQPGEAHFTGKRAEGSAPAEPREGPRDRVPVEADRVEAQLAPPSGARPTRGTRRKPWPARSSPLSSACCSSSSSRSSGSP